MREILFRGKRKDTDWWETGDYSSYVTSDGISRSFINGFEYEVYPETVGQYTGVEDKNDKKIFEGDIVTRHKNSNISMLVKYDEESASFIVAYDIDGKYYENTLCGHMYLEVIGNIHDNPELMGKK